METTLAKQIKARLKVHKLTVSALERKAGLRMSAVRNILRGQSKRPSAESLHAIAKALECTINDLLQDNSIHAFHPKPNKDPPESEDFLTPQQQIVLQQVIAEVLSLAQKRQVSLTLSQIFTIASKAYQFTVDKNGNQVNQPFIEWLVDEAQQEAS